MRVSSLDVLTAIRAGHSSVSDLQSHFRGATREELLSRLHYLCRTGQTVRIGNHRRRNTDRRWRVAESVARQRGRTRCHRLELPVWRALHSTRRQTIAEVNASVPGCWVAIRRALLNLEQQGSARRDAPHRVRRTWVRGDRQPSCLHTRASLGTRRTLLAHLLHHPGIIACSLLNRWSRPTIQGAIKAGDITATPAGISQRLWLATDQGIPQELRKVDQIAHILATVGAGIVPAQPLVKCREDLDCILDLQRRGWLEGSSVLLAGYGLTSHHTGSVPALESLRSFVQHHGCQSLASLGECRPILLRRLQHQDSIQSATESGLIQSP